MKVRVRSPLTYLSTMPLSSLTEEGTALEGDADRDQNDVGDGEGTGDLPEPAWKAGHCCSLATRDPSEKRGGLAKFGHLGLVLPSHLS